ncbi:MAG TPA: hypothetical protein V6C57_02310 [Coleofasciculaceae cyanobacterium]
MKSNVNSDSGTPNTAAQASGAPSVPISVYRELAAELQATRIMLESLNTKNQHLAQQNHQLRQEVARVVQLGHHLRHWIDAPQPVDPVNIHEHPTQSAARQPDPQAPSSEATAVASAIAAKLRTGETLPSDQLFTEAAAQPIRLTEAKPAKDLSGLWLTLTIMFIIISAFGAGFLVMKPFLSGNR